jgi:RimJ/RimL family protein N-acetyltransferase
MAAFPSRDMNAFMAHWARILSNDTIIKKTILLDGQVAGNVVCFGQAGEREVGYWIGKPYWGKGIATSALSQFLAHVQARPLYAHVAKHNVASLRVLQKCGFVITGEDKGRTDTGDEQVEAFILTLTVNTSD